MIWIALMSMVVGTLMQHLGLSEAIARVITKIAKCHRCCSFWLTLAVMIYYGYEPFESLVLSILMAYLSNFFGLVLLLMNKLYTKLWQRIEK